MSKGEMYNHKDESVMLGQKLTVTEEDAIKITIEHGYDGSEFNTSVWKSRGCLTPNRTMDALVGKLKTIYHNVKVKGKGKKREYILQNKKEAMTERDYNYKGTVPSKEEVLMKEYIFNYLVKTGGGIARPYNAWGRELGLFKYNLVSTDIIEEIKNLHSGAFFNPAEIVTEFRSAISNYNKSLIENSFRWLEKEGRVSRFEQYFFKTTDGGYDYEEVDAERYEEALTFKKELISSYDISYSQYLMASYGNRSDRMQNIIKEVDEQMAAVFDLKYMFKSIGVTLIDKKQKEDISKDEFEQAYFQKFIKLADNRQNRTDYQESKSFWRRTYLMNTLKILSFILKDKFEVKGLEESLLKEMKRKSENEFLDYTGDLDDVFK